MRESTFWLPPVDQTWSMLPCCGLVVSISLSTAACPMRSNGLRYLHRVASPYWQITDSLTRIRSASPRQILQCLTRKVALAPDVSLEELAHSPLLEHFTGSDLQAMLYTAQIDAIHALIDTDTAPKAASHTATAAAHSSAVVFVQPDAPLPTSARLDLVYKVRNIS